MKRLRILNLMHGVENANRDIKGDRKVKDKVGKPSNKPSLVLA